MFSHLLAIVFVSAVAAPSAGGGGDDGLANAGSPTKAEKVCRRLQATGTRLGSKRVCKTAAQWKADDAASYGDQANPIQRKPDRFDFR